MMYEHVYINDLTIPVSKDIGYIYKLTSPNNKIYIGQTLHLNKRFISHKKDSIRKDGLLQKSIKKYGFDSYKIEILDEVKVENLDSAEQFYIAICNSFYKKNKNGLNLTLGGNGCRGATQTQETKDKRAAAIKKAALTEDGKKRRSDAQKEKWKVPGFRERVIAGNKNKIISDETKQKIRDARKNQVFSEETLKKFSERQKKLWQTEEYRNKISGRKMTQEEKDKLVMFHKGIKRSDETRKKISEGRMGYVCKEETKQKLREINTGKKWTKEAIEKREATRRLNRSTTPIKPVSEETRQKMRDARNNYLQKSKEQRD